MKRKHFFTAWNARNPMGQPKKNESGVPAASQRDGYASMNTVYRNEGPVSTASQEERQRLHLTQAQLAEDVDISDTYMGAIERGERSLTLDTLVRLVNRLGVTVDYLLADSVTGGDETILDEFKQIVDNQPLERKLMALQVLRTIFAYFEKEGT